MGFFASLFNVKPKVNNSLPPNRNREQETPVYYTIQHTGQIAWTTKSKSIAKREERKGATVSPSPN